MRAMVLERPGAPLTLTDLPIPEPKVGQVLLKVQVCGVCRTDLHLIDGELPDPKLRVIPGHQIVGTVVQSGPRAERYEPGQRVGVPWLGWTCGTCRYCMRGQENLCDHARFTGYTLDGGYAEYTVADERFCFPIPDGFSDLSAAPLLCAGLIGYRAYRMTSDASVLGFYGFGAAAHLITQVATHQGKRVLAFTREGDTAGQAFAREMGAAWAGPANAPAPEELDAAIIFAATGELVPQALRAVRKGGTVICAGIHTSDIPSFPYQILWGEREVKSVANLTREDGEAFLRIAPQVPVKSEVTVYPLENANEALHDLRTGQLSGAAVLQVESTAPQ